MSFNFTRYDSSTAVMTIPVLTKVKTLLLSTARLHHDRDLRDENNNNNYFTDQYLLNLIHTKRKNDVADPNGHNWMIVEYGQNANTHSEFKNKGDVVIIYRLMQHRIRLVGRMQWSLTVGFDQRLLTKLDGSDQTNAVYLDFANILAGQIRLFSDPGGHPPIDFIMIDDPPGGSPSTSKVQRLFDLAQANSQHPPVQYPDLHSVWQSSPEHIPHSEQGVRYGGYDNNVGMIVTTIKLLP